MTLTESIHSDADRKEIYSNGEVCTQGKELTNGNIRMEKTFGLHHGIAVICGLVIGSGIYISPKGVLMGAHSAGLALILWALAGIISLLGALTFAELGTTFPVAGEKYAYLEEMYGPFVAFLFLCSYLFMVRVCANAIKCLTFANYFVSLIYINCDAPKSLIFLLAISLAAILTFINCISVKLSATVQTVFASLNILMLATISLIGIVYLFQGHTEHTDSAFSEMPDNIVDVIVGLYAGLYAAGGWNAINFLIEELKNPYRNLPLAAVIAVLLTTVLFVLVNLAYVVVLGPEGIIASEAVAVTFGQKTLGPFAWIITVVLTINMVASFNSGTLVSSRLSFAGARRGHLPKLLALVSTSYSSPITSLLMMGGLVGIVCTTSGIFALMKNMVFVMAVFDLLTVAGMLYLRYKKPNLPRPIKMPLLVPVLYLLAMLLIVIVPLITKPSEVAVGCLILICTALPYYFIFVMWKSKPKSWLVYYEKIHIFVQKLTNSALSK